MAKIWNDEIYVSAFDKQDLLISQLEKFGFNKVGFNLNGEGVYIKNRHNIDYSDPYKSFPFLTPILSLQGILSSMILTMIRCFHILN